MSVSSAVTLPNQPTVGTVFEIPLGGDGFTAPRSVYAVEVTLTHDASGGNAGIIVTLDPRYTELVSYICCTLTSASTDPTPCQFVVLQNGDDVWTNVVNCQLLGATAVGEVRPPGMLLVTTPGGIPQAQVNQLNVDGDTTKLNMRIYNFEREMIRKVPISLAMFAIPR